MPTQARLKTALSERFGIDVPIFGFSHSVAVTAAISNAGGLGVYGATRDTPEEIGARLAEIRALVGRRPFGVDLVLPRGMPESNDRARIEAQLPDEHRRFVAALYAKYQVPPASKPGMRSRFVRSDEVAEQQIAAVLQSDVTAPHLRSWLRRRRAARPQWR
jgi:Nitronate monooxygenase